MKMKSMIAELKCFLFPVESEGVGDKLKETLVEYDNRQRRTEIYFELFLVFLASGALLFWVMTAIFDLCVADWKAGGDLRVKDLWNILMYAIPYTLIAVSAGFFITGMTLSVYFFFTCRVDVYFIRRRKRRKAHKERLQESGGQDAN